MGWRDPNRCYHNHTAVTSASETAADAFVYIVLGSLSTDAAQCNLVPLIQGDWYPRVCANHRLRSVASHTGSQSPTHLMLSFRNIYTLGCYVIAARKGELNTRLV